MIDATKPVEDALIARTRAWMGAVVPVPPGDYATCRVVVACGPTQATIGFTVRTTYGPDDDPKKARRTDHVTAAVMWDAESAFAPDDAARIVAWARQVVDLMTTDLAMATGDEGRTR